MNKVILNLIKDTILQESLSTIAICYQLSTYLMCKEHIIYNFLVNDRSLIHQGVDFSPGPTLFYPLKQENEAINRTAKKE